MTKTVENYTLLSRPNLYNPYDGVRLSSSQYM